MGESFVSFNVVGDKELKKALRRIAPAFMAEMEKALPEEGAALMAAANAQVPGRSGELRSSAIVTSATNGAKTKTKTVAAYTAEYAAAVHEGIFGGHKAKVMPASFKWYEHALNGFVGGFKSRILSRLRALVSSAT